MLQLEGTRGVRTHAVLLLTLTLTLTFQPKNISLVGYRKGIPYTKFGHLGSFVFELCSGH